MSEEELENLASDKEVSPEMLSALLNQQAYFEQVFGEIVRLDDSEPGQDGV